VTGVTSTNGISDSWNGAVTADYVGLGVTDVEPAQLTGYDSPLSITTGNGDAPNAVAYKTTAFGNATPTQMSGLSTVALYQQVFALAVNTSGQSFSTVNLNRETASNILLGGISDWSKAIDAGTGSPISSVSSPISVIQREYGSGTRTTANIYFNQYCNGGGVAMKGTNAPLGLNYSTGDDLTQANSTAGSIAYAVIDQLEPNSTTYPNLVMVTLDGVTPSNLNAAVGKYDYWYEATFVPSSTLSGTSKTLADFLETDVPQLLKAPPDPADNVIPGYAGNSAVFPTPTNNGQTGTKEIYTSQYTRGGVSCNARSEKY
jgi:ABC-type phosphate transport system substrate-binding protein